MAQKPVITIEASVNAPVSKVWDYFTQPEHITQWNAASPDWHSPSANNDLKDGGRFLFRMEARDGSFGFDFTGTYTKVIPHERIDYTMDDDREVKVQFTDNGDSTFISQTFEAEAEHPLELQREGWQSILNNFKNYTEKK